MKNSLRDASCLPIIYAVGELPPTTTSNKQSNHHNKQKVDFAKAVILGMADLIHSQRQFADEFGLSLNRVFPNSYKALIGNRAKDVVQTLFESGSSNAMEIKNLFKDLKSHQLAMLSGLDGVAEESLKQFKPEIIQASSNDSVNDTRDVHAWRVFKNYYEDISESSDLRHKKIILNGLIRKYEYPMK